MPIEQSPIPSVSDLNREIASGAITPVDLVEGCLSAIERLEPTLKAWETIDRAGALDAAKLATQEISRDGQRSPLHGIPVGLKDIYNTRNLRTSMSSRVFANFVPEPQDSRRDRPRQDSYDRIRDGRSLQNFESVE